MAGDLSGLAEPALVLTPPDVPTEADDGLLTASEIATLKLNADWVVLSACNTAAGGGEGAEALSGLARAFFYAGARALLVSHWAVYSRAATELTTKTFATLAATPNLGRAEAFRRAMLSPHRGGQAAQLLGALRGGRRRRRRAALAIHARTVPAMPLLRRPSHDRCAVAKLRPPTFGWGCPWPDVSTRISRRFCPCCR